MARNTTKLKHKAFRMWTSLTVKDGTIYRIDNTMYQVQNGKYLKIGQVCHMQEDLSTIRVSELID